MLNKTLCVIMLLMTSGFATASTEINVEYASVMTLQVALTLAVLKLASIVRREYATSLAKK